MDENPVALAKVIWTDPETGKPVEHVLVEGDSVSIGRSPDNEIYIPERTVSRHHASISYRSGVFVVSDTGSANGIWVNDDKKEEPYPLIDGDIIRLYMPEIEFRAILPDEAPPLETEGAADTAAADGHRAKTRIRMISGSLTGTEIAISKDSMTFGRAVSNASWEITLPDHAVSRPHARLFFRGGSWYLEDLGSSNGTMIEGEFITQPVLLRDGMTITMGETSFIFHVDS
ncbi:MAG: FHA domain-containing protein [Chloroflexi bacterium]|nr:FHA domain-containing protein [Chloroflexota bacterium]